VQEAGLVESGPNVFHPLGKRIFPPGTVLSFQSADSDPSLATLVGDFTHQGPPLATENLVTTRTGPNHINSSNVLNKAGVYAGYANTTDGLGMMTTINYTIHIGYYVSITSHPQPATKTEGQSHTFYVSAVANPLPRFQWYKNGAPISGATQGALVLNNLTPADFGNYSCVIKQYSGDTFMSEATSSSAQLDVVPLNPPFLTQANPPRLIRGGSNRITGENFGYSAEAVKVVLNGTRVPVAKASGTEIRFKVPNTFPLGQASVKVEVYGVVSSNTISARVIPNIIPMNSLLLD
jgi:hypothetical protein